MNLAKLFQTKKSYAQLSALILILQFLIFKFHIFTASDIRRNHDPVLADEILLSTRFSTTFNTIFSTIFEYIKRIGYQYLSEQLLTTKIFLHKSPYTPPSFKIKARVLHRRCFQNLHFLLHFYQFSQWMRYAIFQINTNLLIIQQNINIFTQETLYSSFISKENWRSNNCETI